MIPVRQITKSLRVEIDSFLPKVKEDKITLLYIDDEPLNLSSFKSVFRRSNFQIFTAKTLEEAFNILAANKVHIVFTDYEMPVHKGDEVLKMILTMYPDIIPVVLSGYLTIERKDNLQKHFSGITLIEKPFNNEEVSETINRCYAVWQGATV